jgi:uncharacterized Ntn-hydrolase superfamily protein
MHLKLNEMKRLIILTLFTLCAVFIAHSQDTFSIVAVDSITGEVGSAGASCVDLYAAGLPNDDFLGKLIPNVGAINTQAYYLTANQNNATNRMNLGETPSQIIDWLVANDVQSRPDLRQYGIAAMINGSPEAAAHTGSSTDNYKNHIVGPNYSIQGNILLGQAVLDSMESRFLNEPGDLACKLMAALQGANMIGADTRCNPNGTSSLFAFVKVAKPTDAFGNPSFIVSVRTASNTGIEPIDSLQTKFDLIHSCNPTTAETPDFYEFFSIYPNPSSDLLTIENKTGEVYTLYLYDITGKLVFEDSIFKTKTIHIVKYKGSSYIMKLTNKDKTFVKKILVNN